MALSNKLPMMVMIVMRRNCFANFFSSILASYTANLLLCLCLFPARQLGTACFFLMFVCSE